MRYDFIFRARVPLPPFPQHHEAPMVLVYFQNIASDFDKQEEVIQRSCVICG